MMEINNDLAQKLPEAELINLISSRLHPSISALLPNRAFATLHELEAACIKASHMLDRHKAHLEPPEQMLHHPVYGDTGDKKKTKPAILNPSVDVFQKPTRGLPPCAGCKSTSHSSAACDVTPKPFCHNCGKLGIKKPDCDCWKTPSKPVCNTSCNTVENKPPDFQAQLNLLTDCLEQLKRQFQENFK